MQLFAAPHLELRAGLVLSWRDEVQVFSNGASLLVAQLPRLLIRDPAVDTTTTRVDEDEVLEAKVLLQGALQNLNGRLHEGPALDAELRTRAAGSDVIVVVHID